MMMCYLQSGLIMKSQSRTDYYITTEIRWGHKWFIIRDAEGNHKDMRRKYSSAVKVMNDLKALDVLTRKQH